MQKGDNYSVPLPRPPAHTCGPAREGTKKELCYTYSPSTAGLHFAVTSQTPLNKKPTKKTIRQIQKDDGRMFSGSPRSSPLDGPCDSLRTSHRPTDLVFYSTPTTCLYEFLTARRMNSRRQRGRRPLQPKMAENFFGGWVRGGRGGGKKNFNKHQQQLHHLCTRGRRPR